MTQQTGSLKCPNCGAEVSPDCVQCSWCRSTLSTVSCPNCFASLFLGMKHCPHCGAETARVNAAESAPRNCPHCRTSMSVVKIGECDLRECQQCGGLWVEKSAFQRICEQKDEQQAVLGMASPVSAASTGKSKGISRLYVPCPECGNLMNRMNFAGCSGVIIDWCRPHGSWFDYQELRQIVTFIREGGLRKSREREIVKIQEETRRLRQQERDLAVKSMRQEEVIQVGGNWKDDHQLLSDILSAIWKGLPEKH